MNNEQNNQNALPTPCFIHSVGNSALQLSPIKVDSEYCKKWNVHMEDFVVLTRNGEVINNNLYRVGGLNNPNPEKDNYFMLIKYVEAFYSKEILRMSKTRDPKHLEGRWCIIDKNGVEKLECKQSKNPYLIKNSCIYSIDSNYYNIETGEHYCHATSAMQTTDYLFLENSFDSDKSKRGVLKICKKSGTYEMFS